MYKVVTVASALGSLARMPRRTQMLLHTKIAGLTLNPRPYGVKKLTAESTYRIRQGDYRILYEIHDSEKLVIVTAVRHRSEAYR